MTTISKAELTEHAAQFILYLAEAGYEAAVDPESYRDYMVKLTICRAGHGVGTLKLFHKPTNNTFKASPEKVRDSEDQTRLLMLHSQFMCGASPTRPAASNTVPRQDRNGAVTCRTASLLAEVEHYYAKLSPYRDQHVDFTALKQALSRALERTGRALPDDTVQASDFETLERLYFNLKKEFPQ